MGQLQESRACGRGHRALGQLGGRVVQRNAVTEVELMKEKFEWDRDLLAKDQAAREKIIAGYTAESKKAELENADKQIRRREIR